MEQPKQQQDENHYFEITFEDGTTVTWGVHPLDLRGDHMGGTFAREREEQEAKAEHRAPRRIVSVKRNRAGLSLGSSGLDVSEKLPRGCLIAMGLGFGLTFIGLALAYMLFGTGPEG